MWTAVAASSIAPEHEGGTPLKAFEVVEQTYIPQMYDAKTPPDLVEVAQRYMVATASNSSWLTSMDEIGAPAFSSARRNSPWLSRPLSFIGHSGTKVLRA